MEFKRQRGTVDLYDDEVLYFNQLESILKYVANQYNFKEIRTPIFESTNLYTKAVGESSDIVHKEFYNFKDKGDREIALRPEGTAGTIRAIVEEKMLANLTGCLKVFYMGPMFRYERPQSGRQRQFHQFGIEVVGDVSINDEVETICLAISILNTLKIKNYKLQINNIGSAKARNKWISELKKYFEQYKDQLSQDSINRLQTNPLRILDDKEDAKKDFVINAPKLEKFLSKEETLYFEKIKVLLDLLAIDYEVNENLVRGLDYYNGLVYEFISLSDQLKGQSTIIGGGKYDGLVKLTGGPDVAGIGFGLGIERLIVAIKDENKNFINKQNVDIVFAPLSQKCSNLAVLLNMIIRTNGFSLACNYNSFKLEKHFKLAEKLNAKYVFIFGDKELDKQEIIIKNQLTKKETIISIKEIENFLKEIK